MKFKTLLMGTAAAVAVTGAQAADLSIAEPDHIGSALCGVHGQVKRQPLPSTYRPKGLVLRNLSLDSDIGSRTVQILSGRRSTERSPSSVPRKLDGKRLWCWMMVTTGYCGRSWPGIGLANLDFSSNFRRAHAGFVQHFMLMTDVIAPSLVLPVHDVSLDSMTT